MRQLSREFEGLWHAELCSNFMMKFRFSDVERKPYRHGHDA